ncbi:MAG: NYN domain-containing protein [archaeon]
MEDTLIFVDNGFFKLVKDNFEKKSGKRKKLLQTFRNIAQKENLNLKHLFFYYAPPYQDKEASEKENKLMKDYSLIKKMISGKGWASFREGRCQRLKVDGKYKYAQKGVDILLVTDLMRFERKFPDVKKLILVACDSDFVPVIEQLKKEGVEVILWTYFDRKRNSPFSRYNELLKTCSRWVKLKSEDFD